MFSTVGIKFTKNELNIVKLPCFIKGVMIGLLLFDGYIVFSSRSKNGRLGLTQSLDHLSYIYFVYNILVHYCPRYPFFTKRSRFNKPTFSLEFFTRSMPCITEFDHNFSIEKVKTITFFIYNILTPVALAHWIMGNGTFNGISLLLCTDCYLIKNIVLLINVYLIIYDINCSIRNYKHRYSRIYVLKAFMPKLRIVVLPYMHTFMYAYKLGL